jgi:hypothetical protein
MANRRFIDFPIAASVGNNDIVLIWQDGLNKQTTKATLLQGSPQSLAGLTDVDIAGLINGQILQYNSTTSKWENVDRTDINLSELGDVTIVAPANGQVLVYNSSTSKWENSSAGYVPYTGAVTTVNLGAQSILAGSFVKAGGTSAQFLKADGSVDSSTYGTGTVTSVALTMPTAFSVANSPITSSGTLAVTATGTTAQYIRGDGSLATFPGLTGFVPYTGATADVNLGTHDLLAERGTFANNGSSDTLTVNHTSGSGYGIIVTKGGNNEALYVSKTSGSGNAMTVVGGRTSLVDLALSSVTNTAGDFLTLSGGVVHKRTAAQTLTDIGGQAALTNPVTGTGTSGTLPKFTGSTTIGNSLFTDNGTNGAFGGANYATGTDLRSFNISATFYPGLVFWANNVRTGDIFGYTFTGNLLINADPTNVFADTKIGLGIDGTERLAIFSNGNVSIGNSPTDAGFKLNINSATTGLNVGNQTNSLKALSTFSKTLTTGFGTSNNYLQIGAGENGLNGTRLIGFGYSITGNTNQPAYIGYIETSNSGETNGSLIFGTRSVTTDTAPTTRLTIASTGAATFSSSVTAATGINAIGQEQAFTWQRTIGTNSDIYSLNADSGSSYLYNNTTAKVLMTWLEGGNVGIGTSGPGGFLEVSSPNSGNTQMLLVRNFATSATGNFTGIYTAEVRGASANNIRHAMNIHLNENASDRRILDVTSSFGTVASFLSNGNVLVGTTSDVGERLTLNGRIGIVGSTVASGNTRSFFVRGAQSVSDGGTLSINVTNTALIFIAENNTGTGALFFCGYASGTITKISDPSNMFDVADTAGKLCIFKSAASEAATIKNRLGSTRSITVSYIGVSD